MIPVNFGKTKKKCARSFLIIIFILVIFVFIIIFVCFLRTYFFNMEKTPTFTQTILEDRLVGLKVRVKETAPIDSFVLVGCLLDDKYHLVFLKDREGKIIHLQEGDVFGMEEARIDKILPDSVYMSLQNSKEKRRILVFKQLLSPNLTRQLK